MKPWRPDREQPLARTRARYVLASPPSPSNERVEWSLLRVFVCHVRTREGLLGGLIHEYQVSA